MSALDALSTFVGSGGLAAGVATVATAVMKLKEKRLDLEQERARWQYETALHTASAAHERYLAEQELLVTSERAAGSILTATITADGQEAGVALRMDGMPWQVGAFRTLFRPFLTLLLWAAAFAIWVTASDPSTATLIASSVAQAAMTSLGVWFGGRVVHRVE